MISIFKEMWTPPKAQDTLELTRLYRSIEGAFGHQPGSSVSITSAHPSDQVMRLTYDLAWVGSTLLGKRVLVLDTTGQVSPTTTARAWTAPAPAREAKPVNDQPVVDIAPKQALVDMDRALREANDVGLLSLRVSPGNGLAITPQLNEIWGKLETTFDLIIVAAPPVLADPTAACVGTVVDGTILVVSSGNSRAREVKRAVELLNSDSTPLIGIIMTDGRHTLPRWLRWIFGNA